MERGVKESEGEGKKCRGGGRLRVSEEGEDEGGFNEMVIDTDTESPTNTQNGI